MVRGFVGLEMGYRGRMGPPGVPCVACWPSSGGTPQGGLDEHFARIKPESETYMWLMCFFWGVFEPNLHLSSTSVKPVPNRPLYTIYPCRRIKGCNLERSPTLKQKKKKLFSFIFQNGFSIDFIDFRCFSVGLYGFH